MRLFVAIDLSDEARAAITAEQKRIVSRFGASRPPKFVRLNHLHMTLAFIGEVDEARAAGIVHQMNADIAQVPFDLGFGGIGVFPPRGAPRVLWLGVVDGAQPVIELQQRVASNLESAGVLPERRPFHPHLTLARWRERPPSQGFGVPSPREMRRALEQSKEIARTRVAEVTLYESRLSSSRSEDAGGPTYTALARAHLTCP